MAAVLLTGTVLPTGCARSPGMSTGTRNTQIIVTMTLAGRVRPDYAYFVLFNVNGAAQNGQTGPIPVVAAPYGNGFAGGAFTHFVRFDQSQPSGGYGVYAIVPGSRLRTFSYLGPPSQSTPIQTGDRILQFQIPLSRLASSDVPTDKITSLQINFLATNRVPVDPNDPGTKLFDALGDARQPGEVNRFFSILNVTQARVYQNSDSISPEPSGDVAEAGNGVFRPVSEPDLDITDYSIEIRN